MPKKFAGENSKAVAAKARKEEKKKEEITKKQKAVEDEYWKDDDKLVNRKNQRKEEQEKKKNEALQKKAEAKALLEQEMNSIKVSTAGKQPMSKVTRLQIQMETEKRAQVAQPAKQEVDTHISQPLPENINRLQVDGEEARTVEEAISVLSIKETELDKHPEKRMKAAFAAFEEANMPRIKAENPTLRLSQLKQILRKEWLKSPENPTNQRIA